MARYFLILVAAFAFAACGTAPAKNANTQPANTASATTSEQKKSPVDPTIVEFLLTSAVTDFQQHPPGDLAHFRNVRIGHVPATTDGKPQYRMCGEYSLVGHETEGEWTGFATLKTSGYEQYIGSLPLSYCEDKSLVWDDGPDLSAQLQSRFDSLKSKK